MHYIEGVFPEDKNKSLMILHSVTKKNINIIFQKYYKI